MVRVLRVTGQDCLRWFKDQDTQAFTERKKKMEVIDRAHSLIPRFVLSFSPRFAALTRVTACAHARTVVPGHLTYRGHQTRSRHLCTRNSQTAGSWRKRHKHENMWRIAFTSPWRPLVASMQRLTISIF